MILFGYPLFLWGLLSMAVPLVLHLLNRRRPDSLAFPSIRFLFRAQLPQEGRRRLRDILLLLLRMAILVAVSIIMARPKWVPRADEVNSGSKVAVFLYDCSASMSGWNHKEKAKELVEGAMADLKNWRIEKVFSPNTSGEMAETCLAGEHRAALAKAVELLSGADEARLYLVSDFRINDWSGTGKSVPPDIGLFFLDCGGDGEENVGITSVRTSLLPRNRRRVIVSVENFSGKHWVRKLSVKIGSETQSQAISIPPFGRQRAAFALSDGKGDIFGEAMLDGDEYGLDDVSKFALRVAGKPKAFIIANGTDEEKDVISARFAGNAVAGAEEGGDGFQVTITTALEFLAEDLKDVRLMFILGGTEDIARADLQAMAALVEEGGTLIVTPGPGGSTVTMKMLRDAGLLTAQVTGMVEGGPNVPLGVGWVDPKSSLGHLFEDWSEADLFLFPIFRHLRLRAEEPSRTVMKSLAELPLLIESDHGKGKCYFFGLDFSPAWSAFGLTSSFLPVMRELSRQSVPEGYGVKRIFCGSKLTGKDGVDADTSKPGVLMFDEWPVEVHPPLQESMTERVNVEDLRLTLVDNEANAGINTPLTQEPVEYTRYFAWALALLFLGEAMVRALVKE